MNDAWWGPTPPPDPDPPRSVPLPKISTLEEIEAKVKELERQELIRTLTTNPHDENVEHLMEEVFMVLKMLHGEEVDKKVVKYSKHLLQQREDDLEEIKRIERSLPEPIDSGKLLEHGNGGL